MKIILGSASSRRKTLMNLLKIPFEIKVCEKEEVYDKTKSLHEQCLDISYQKALDIYQNKMGNRIVIGADTIVIYQNKIYGKPKDKEEAIKMLRLFSGTSHEVLTAVTMLIYKDGYEYVEKFYDVTKVYFHEFTDLEIENWVLNNNVCDMAGSYGIQEEFGKFVEKIDGNYYTIVGLPINLVYQKLKKYL